MKLLVFKDKLGNNANYSLKIPSDMDRWKVDSFLDYIKCGQTGSIDAGYLPKPVNPLQHESLRRLINSPESTLNSAITIEQEGRCLKDHDYIMLPAEINIVLLGRTDPEPKSEVKHLPLAHSNKLAFASCRKTIISLLDELFNFIRYPLAAPNREPVTSFGQLVGNFNDALDYAGQIRFLFRIAQLVHLAPFENFSKIFKGVQLHSGCEMWMNLSRGFGGVCAEKTAMLKFVCDILEIPSAPIIGSDSMIPTDVENLLRKYIETDGEYELPVWIQHHLLEIDICGNSFLVDVTGGNIPFYFLDKFDADRLIKNGFRARMVYHVETLNLARTSNWVGDALLTLSQYHAPNLNMQYVFQQGLGLQIDRQVFIAVFFDWGAERSARMQNYYASLARKVRFPFPRFIHADNLHCLPDRSLFMLLDNALAALRNEYSDHNYTGDFTFVIQPVSPHFWIRPRVSKSVRENLWKSNLDMENNIVDNNSQFYTGL